MKKLLILLCVLAIAGLAFADVIIGTGTSSQRPPMSTYYKYYRSAAVYLGSEISAGAGTITHLQWYCGIANTTTAIPTKIYLKSTASNTLAGDTWANQVTGAALVFDASVTANATGWFNYDITDTAYNGSGNLEVLIETVNTPYVSPYVEWRYTSTSPSYRFISNAADSATPASLYTSYSRPNIKFVGISAVVYPEPTNHVTDFAAGTLNYTSVQLNWTGSTGAQLPAKYLIQAIKSPGTYASVADGTPVADDAVWTDNNAAINVAHVVGANTYTFTGLTSNTAYEFKIWPYTNSLTDIDFKTDGTIPTVTASTLSTTLPIPYSQDFSASTSLPANWTGTMSVNATHGNGGGNGLTSDLYSYNTSCNIATNPIGPMVAVCELKFDYRIVNYTGYPATATTLGASDNFQVQISANGGAYSTIYTINSTNHVTSNAYATITLPLTTYDTQTINVKFIGTWGAGDYYFDLDNIIVREPPSEAQFAINPTLTEAWAFGTIQTGTTLKKQFTITNTGAASLNISSISTSDTYYGVEEIAPIDHALTAGESTSFYATFTPTVVGGPYSGTVTVTWSSG
ncbi:MAG: hypothetical protein PHO32_01410, partial [Candidatus Cloacimonetes bacterium]|nr:hypothetical protein [Candidatus Cloacimonadota bacterium]